MVTIYSSILLSFGLVYIRLWTKDFSYFETSYQLSDQLIALLQAATKDTSLILHLVIVWLQKSAKRYEYSDEEGDISILPTTISLSL